MGSKASREDEDIRSPDSEEEDNVVTKPKSQSPPARTARSGSLIAVREHGRGARAHSSERTNKKGSHENKVEPLKKEQAGIPRTYAEVKAEKEELESALDPFIGQVRRLIREAVPPGFDAMTDTIIDYLYAAATGRGNAFARLMYRKLSAPLTGLNCRPFQKLVDEEFLMAIARSYVLLDTLVLDECHVSTTGMAAICEGCPHLRRISFYNCRLEVEQLRELHQLKGLTDILISHTSLLSEDLVAFIRASPKLRNVNFSCLDNGVDDAVIMALADHCPDLQFLCLHDAGAITMTPFLRLAKERPRMTFSFAGSAQDTLKALGPQQDMEMLETRSGYSHLIYDWKREL